VWLLAFIFYDFLFYWMHRAGHEVRMMWASHVNHHSSEHYNLSTALRQSWTEHFFAWGFWWPLALVGLPFEVFITISTVNLLYQYWLHTELIGDMGAFGWLFNTPAFHRVHHGVNLEYLDKNYAGMFIIWDRMFGTFEPEVAQVRYGITTKLETYNPVKVAFHEWVAMFHDARQAKTWRGRLGIFLRPPGWREDGQHETVKALLAREESAAECLAPVAAE
jgi:sterol desaturase/sphingolipid hydroxylase (fatty acid hydroxylase superfamily)